MYEFKPYATENSLAENASRFDVQKTGFDDWKIHRTDYEHDYTLTKNDGVYCLSCLDSWDSWQCFFVIVDDTITIGTATRNGRNIKAASILKVFSQITMCMWGLIQVGKINPA